jgi:hypothetical protein
VTTTANETVAPIHDRMPVILEPEDFDTWLNVDGDVTEALALMRPASASVLNYYAISTAVNKVVNDEPFIQQPLIESQVEEDAKASSRAPVKKPRTQTAQIKAQMKARQGDLF